MGRKHENTPRKNTEKLSDKNIIKKRYKADKPEIQRAIAVMKNRGFFTEEFEEMISHKYILFVYYYVCGVLNGKANAAEAARKAGYKSYSGQAGYKILHRPIVATAIKKLLTRHDFLKTDIVRDLNEMRNCDMADFQSLIDGTKTLKDLRDEGVDTSLIENYSEGVDRSGNRYVKIQLPKRLAVNEALTKTLDTMDKNKREDESAGKQNNQFVIISNVPSHKNRMEVVEEHDETDDAVDAEFEDVE